MVPVASKEKMSVSKATSTLINLILQMPPKEIIATLHDLEKKYTNTRNPSSMNCRSEVVFAVGKRFYKGLASTINSHGIFIETPEKFTYGESLTLSFEFKNPEQQVKAAGKISNITRDGIGVKFDAAIETYLKQ